MRRATIVMINAAISLLPLIAWSGSDCKCTMKDLQQTAGAAFVFADWRKLYDSYARFRHCDQGGDASEGYSEGVVRLLADHWEKLPELAELSRSHKSFRKFVLRHIDATTNDDDLKKILQLSKSQCPTNAALLCAAISTQTKTAIKESES